MTPTRRHEQPDDRPRRSKLRRAWSALCALDNRIADSVGGMSPRQTAVWLLGVSVLFAGAMIAVSWLQGPDDSQSLVYMLIAVWWVPFSLLSSAAGASGRRRCANRD